MPGKTEIEWTNRSWNPVTGCTEVTRGCDFCYARAFAERFRGVPNHPYQQGFDLKLWPDRLEIPLRWKKPQRIFVNSMSDLFHSDVPEEYIFQVFDVMRRAHWHTFQVLTKRPGRLRRLGQRIQWPSNVWMGVSIENDSLTPRANALREIPAAVKFLSCEPLLGPLPSLNLDGLHWVIVGGESGLGARPISIDWVRDLRDRCVDAQVPFFFKQWGGRTPKAGGRLLDGRTWDEYPDVRNKRRIGADDEKFLEFCKDVEDDQEYAAYVDQLYSLKASEY